MYHFLPQLLLRTPAYPYSLYEAADWPALLRDPYFRAAVYVASKSLYQEVARHGFAYASLPDRVRSSLQKYLNRMCYRPTPFGLFSGFTPVPWGENEQQLVRLQQHGRRLHQGLAFDEVLGQAAKLCARELASCHRYQRNGSLYRVAEAYRYLRYEQDATKGRRTFFIESIACQPLLKAVLSFCRKSQTKEAILQLIAERTEAPAEDCDAFFGQLVAQQVLVSTLEANITGEDYLHRLQGLVGALPAQTLRPAAAGTLPTMGSAAPGNGKAAETNGDWRQVAEGLHGVFSRKGSSFVNLENGPAAGALSTAYQEQLREGLGCLRRLVPAQEPAGLQVFCNAFAKKFENRAVPLLVALDPETGVGYEALAVSWQPPQLLAGLSFEDPAEAPPVVAWTPAHGLLLDKWAAATQPGAPIRLTAQDMARLPGPEAEGAFPPSLSVLFRIADGKVYLEQAGGVSATALLGRFTPLNEAVHTMARSIAAHEEKANPEVIFAEIAHLGDAHTANIDRRATVRTYEIPVLVQSTLPAARQIALSELWVRVEGGRVVLWAERLQKVVVPRLSSAFNYRRDDLAVFRFLCDMQYQGLQSHFTLDLGSFFPNLSYYPRVEYKEAILHLATWHLQREHLLPLLQAPAAAQSGMLQDLARELGWPRHIALTRHDHQLVFDLERAADRTFFRDAVKQQDTVIIKEFPFAAGQQAPVQDERGKPYVHQYLAALYHEQEVYKDYRLKAPRVVKAAERKRKLLPGSAWLYVKIYCHPASANQLLTANLLPVLKRLVKKGAIRQWFFVRYRDPAFHLRVRLQLTGEDTGTVLAALHRPLSGLVMQGTVGDVQLATYERELERYGAELIEAVEDVFCASSALVAAYLKEAAFHENEAGSYSLVFAGVVEMLRAFELPIKEKVTLFGQLWESFYKEFGEGKSLRKQLGGKYREISKETGAFQDAAPIPGTRTSKLSRTYTASLQRVAQNTTSWPPERRAQLLADLMHMHLNRLFSDQARKQELVVYYCLWQHYRSVMARSSG